MGSRVVTGVTRPEFEFPLVATISFLFSRGGRGLDILIFLTFVFLDSSTVRCDDREESDNSVRDDPQLHSLRQRSALDTFQLFGSFTLVLFNDVS